MYGRKTNRRHGPALSFTALFLSFLLSGCELGFPFLGPKLDHLSSNPIDLAIKGPYEIWGPFHYGIDIDQLRDGVERNLDQHFLGLSGLGKAVHFLENMGASCRHGIESNSAECRYSQWVAWERYVFPFGWCEDPKIHYFIRLEVSEAENGVVFTVAEITERQEESNDGVNRYRCRAERPEY